MLIPNKYNGYSADGRRIYNFGPSSGPTYTESKVTNSNIPEYAQPYVENMLGAAQKQVYGADGTSFQPYKAYGGTYDAQGNQTSYDPSKGIAGFQPLQQQAQAGIQGMQVPGQFAQGAQGAMDVAGQANVGGFQNQVGGYMSPYMQNVVDIQKREAGRQSAVQGTQQQAQAASVGALGGGRDAIMRAERERNLGQQMNDIQAQGSQAAFQGAQQQYNQNMQNQLSAYGQAGTLAGQGIQAQQNVYGLQNQVGAQQQGLEQQKLNQAQQDYANTQQYPLMQLGSLSNMLRGLPMQASSTNMYQAQPNALTQGIGAAGTAASLYNAYNNSSAPKAPGAGAEGGLPSEFKYAEGGITSIPRYDVGGQVAVQLQQMDDKALENEAKTSPSPRIREMAQAILKQRQAGMDTAPQPIEAPQPQQDMGMAGGGIVAFTKGDEVKYKTQTTASQEKDAQRAEDRERLLTVPAAIADLIRVPGNAIVNAIGVHGANLSNRAINALTGSDLKTDYGPGLPYGEYLNAVQNRTRGGKDGRATTATDPRVKAALSTPLDTSGIKSVAAPAPAAAPLDAVTPAAAPVTTEAAIYDERLAILQSELKKAQAVLTDSNSTPQQQGWAQGNVISLTREISRLKPTAAPKAAPAGPAAAPKAAPPAPPAPPAHNSIIAAAPPAAAPPAVAVPAVAVPAPPAVAVPAPPAVAVPAPPAVAVPAAAFNSIMAAAPLDAVTPTADTAAITAAQVDPLADARKATNAAQALGDKSVLARLTENAEARKALGLDQNEAQREYMKSTMAQKANIAADAEQRKYLRLAEFFSSWGSTPGDTLVAGMQAVKAKIPDMIADIKEQRKAMADADKILYELGQADRKEKLGQFEEATKQKEEAGKLAMQLQVSFNAAAVNVYGSKTAADASMSNARTGAGAQVQSAGIGAGAQVQSSQIGANASMANAATGAGAQVQSAQIGANASMSNAATAANASIKSHEIMAAAGVTGHQIMAGAQNYATSVREAGDALARTGQTDQRNQILFNHQTDQLKDLSGKLSTVLNTGEAQKLQDVILRAKLVPDNAQLQAQAKAAAIQLNTITKPIEDQIKMQKANVDAAGKRAFGADWATVSAPVNTTDPLGLRK